MFAFQRVFQDTVLPECEGGGNDPKTAVCGSQATTPKPAVERQIRKLDRLRCYLGVLQIFNCRIDYLITPSFWGMRTDRAVLRGYEFHAFYWRSEKVNKIFDPVIVSRS